MNPVNNTTPSTGNISFSGTALNNNDHHHYLSEWAEWAESGSPGEHRALALARLKLCQENNESHLDLSELQLRSLPSLPEHIVSLKVGGNTLTSLPRLPHSLKKINALFNQLTTLPELPASLTDLNVSRNRLTTLPELPASLTDLNVSRNRLTTLPELPASLTDLNVSCNRLTTLPELPASLTDLNVGRNQLTTLPELPASLTGLDVSCNQLTTLPELPSSLKRIDAYINQILVLPELPASLTGLNVWGNRLTTLPELPASLTDLNVGRNQLTTLPELPASLKQLEIRCNHLTTLPALPAMLAVVNAENNALESLPDFPVEHGPGVRIYFFGRNRLTNVPESILTLSSESTVVLTGNPLSFRTIQTLLRQTTGLNYRGPRIHFAMSDGQQHTPVRPLSEAVTAWFPENKQSDVSQIWLAFESEEHADTFSAFLDRLADTVSARNAQGFRQQVSAFLEKLSTSEELRQQSFAVAADGTQSCEDRVALTWNNLQKSLLVHQASEGLFDNDTRALLSLGREMFRLEVLEHIARDKVRTLHFVDEIEVYLAFQTMLAEKLQLSTAMKEMRFYDVSGVTEYDLRTAEAMVRSREESEFTDWFSLWGPWHAVLKRTEADRWAQVEKQKYELLENEYPQRVAEQLKLNAPDLSGDADAEREVGALVMREAEQQIYRQLTDEVLALRLPENGSRPHHS
ncbi:E3 ubiquitin--protein ligase [Escherichia coli]|nr:E3 ubiquitin--protein ligase [Escherichia coli]